MISRPLEERFWEKVNKAGPVPVHVPDIGQCWEWTACLDHAGYGMIGLGRRMLHAHRVAWSLVHGDAGALHVLHKCDNPRCVRVEHLFLGTHADNARDRAAKGRSGPTGKILSAWWVRNGRLRGAAHGRAKLTADQVREIRLAASAGAKTARQARLYGVGCSTITHIIDGTNWKHVT